MSNINYLVANLEHIQKYLLAEYATTISPNKALIQEWVRALEDTVKELKNNTPYIIPLEELLNKAGNTGLPCWVEDRKNNIIFPAVIYSDANYIEYCGNDVSEGAIYHKDYQELIRCWSTYPNEMQRKVV